MPGSGGELNLGLLQTPPESASAAILRCCVMLQSPFGRLCSDSPGRPKAAAVEFFDITSDCSEVAPAWD